MALPLPLRVTVVAALAVAGAATPWWLRRDARAPRAQSLAVERAAGYTSEPARIAGAPRLRVVTSLARDGPAARAHLAIGDLVEPVPGTVPVRVRVVHGPAARVVELR